jgi:TerC family integral membrane protein
VTGRESSLLIFWIIFNLFVVAMLALDLGVLHRRARVMSFQEALAWSGAWIALALAFAVLLHSWQGYRPALEFVTGYVLELSLSVDNLFLFLLIFRYFRVPEEYQHKVLFWGVLGALIMRGIFILAGVELLQKLESVVYGFGALLIYSGIKLLRQRGADIQPEKNPVLRLFRRWVSVTEDYEGDKFFVRRAALYATPLLVVLVVIETTDVLFAVDSVPAILAITLNAFIVYTSNVFAILGLRAMYFALAGMMETFEYLHYGLALILVLFGSKMLASHFYNVRTEWALAAVAGILLASVLASLAKKKILASRSA